MMGSTELWMGDKARVYLKERVIARCKLYFADVNKSTGASAQGVSPSTAGSATNSMLSTADSLN